MINQKSPLLLFSFPSLPSAQLTQKLLLFLDYRRIKQQLRSDERPRPLRALRRPRRRQEGFLREGHTKIINAASFTIEREDHTIGNILRIQLQRDPDVLFAGYKLPHPLQYKILVRIHTTNHSSPMQAYNQAVNDLDEELDHLRNAFEVEVAKHSWEY